MSASESQSAVVLELAEEFLERYRRGRRPSLKEYVDRHPELAAEIREVFPAMAMMENIALADESLHGSATETPRPSAAEPPLPELIGDYRIIRSIGHGGMGLVYEAEQVSLGRHVALKILPPQMVRDRKQRLRFEREARAAVKLHHSNIVPAFGVGEHEGAAYYVMQYIQGLPLDAVIEELKWLRPGGAAAPSHATKPALRNTRADVSVADVARSLMTGRFDQTAGVGSQFDSQVPPTVATTPLDGMAVLRGNEAGGAPRAGSAESPSGSGTSGSGSSSSSFCPAPASSAARAGRGPRPTGRAWPASGCKSPRRSNTPTSRASCTAISSLRTCCSTLAAPSGSPTSAWPRPTTSRT
jgi:hypothetical protein